ncbi:unnamed protein product [Fusarium graminearum]|uniref:Chromosome 1, complete genome n=1 Tax=Gibberella zeae (strain ATCC MYA-4620 / CBS 123657 / FGSC 9075 / NRRL 31084 / PH-1) TaxID=229533 RepID=A0A1C3YHR5_GIBZE|nr:unnamed protein product [Fusarium graminearum]
MPDKWAAGAQQHRGKPRERKRIRDAYNMQVRRETNKGSGMSWKATDREPSKPERVAQNRNV